MLRYDQLLEKFYLFTLNGETIRFCLYLLTKPWFGTVTCEIYLTLV